MTGTVHRLDGIGPTIGFNRKHSITELVGVTRFFPEAHIHQLRRFDLLIPMLILDISDIPLEGLPYLPASRMPKHHARRFFLGVKQIEALAEFAMISLFRLFQAKQIFLQRFLIAPSGPVDPLEHFIIGIAAPIGARDLR